MLSLLIKSILYCSSFLVIHTHTLCICVCICVCEREAERLSIVLSVTSYFFFKLKIFYMSTVFTLFLLLLPRLNSSSVLSTASQIQIYYFNQETSALCFETGSHCKMWLLIWVGWVAVDLQGSTCLHLLSTGVASIHYHKSFIFPRVHPYALITCWIQLMLLKVICL